MQHNHFGDVQGEIDDTRGVLDGGAYRNQERVQEKAVKEGFTFELNCQSCNRPCRVTVPWTELIVASVGVLPLDEDSRQPWIMQQGCMYPPVRCLGCRNPLSVPITPDKAARFLRTGISMGAIQSAQVQAAQQETMRQAQQLRR
jgi:hypothetical protein